MFRRAFWFTTGAAAGVWATTRIQRKLRTLAPESLAVRAADQAAAAGHRVRDFALDVRSGMAQREHELTEALGLTADPDGPDGAAAEHPNPTTTLRAVPRPAEARAVIPGPHRPEKRTH
ncbi:DUF6167 family protein [Streptomyces xiamenensis]|uniref:Secreted protein n=1 Tax=Streptomyces xiamenensis TaxID=408015 RepID=A0A0F7CMT9_9ACTN|nr:MULTISPECIES: DUF6167 family protein [Streptomyces]AKG41741.1 secreted protein [Streptomyces xiamenensis]